MKRYLLIAILTSLIFSFIYIYTQVLGIMENIDVWITTIPLHNAILFIIFAAIFGIAISFQIYNWKQPKVCKIKNKSKSAGISSSVTFLGLIVSQCPACASIGALFLPVSAITFLVKYSTIINILNIALLLFVINYLGGFRKV